MGEPKFIILQGTKNFILWYDYIKTKIQKKKLMEYILEDKIDHIDIENPKSSEEVNLLIENASVRICIIKSISPEIHKEIVGIVSAYKIMKILMGKYGGDKADTAYWITCLNSLSTTKENKIMDILKEMKRIFEAMESNKLTMRNDEKIKYLYNAIPKSYISKIMLKDDDTFDSLYEKIEADLKIKSYIEGWQLEDNEIDDLMEVDYVRKNHTHNLNFNNNQNNYDNHNNYNTINIIEVIINNTNIVIYVI